MFSEIDGEGGFGWRRTPPRLDQRRAAMTRSADRQSGKPLRRGQIASGAADVRAARDQAAKVQTLSGLEERLARELVQGLVQSALARGVDPATRLREFRTLQEAAMAVSQDPAVADTAERLVGAIDLTLQVLATVKS